MPDHKHTLSIDIETFSSVDLRKCGVYKYASSPDFEILILAYKVDDQPTQLANLSDGRDLENIIYGLQSPDYLKTAFNAPFERACLSRYFGINLPADQWECTMAKAYQCGMSGGLDMVAQILRVGEKITDGKNLIPFFCTPKKPTKKEPNKTRNFPADHPDRFKQFENYCIRDVDLEYRIRKILNNFPTIQQERALWILDQQINDKGVKIDRQLVENAIAINEIIAGRALDRLKEITGVSSGKAVGQLKTWLQKELDEDEEIESLSKDSIPKILSRTDNETIHEVLNLRKLTAKSSISKYAAMLRWAGSDDRIRGMFQYCGAARTGRWAGRGPQPQNYPRTDMPGLDQARRLVKAGDLEGLEMCFDNVLYVLSQLLRTAFIAENGYQLIPSDFSAIEARVTAWLSGEQWRLDVFNGDGKIYEASAAAMFGKKIEDIKKGSDERSAGKVAELALGFGGSTGALAQMIKGESARAAEQGKPWTFYPSAVEMKTIVNAWRAASPNIVSYWWHVQGCAIQAIENPGARVSVGKGIYYQVKNSVLFCELPGGRKLCYLRPRMVEGKFGPAVSYEGIEPNGKKTWGRVETYGGKLVENIVQAIARDLLAAGMLRLDAAGYEISLHVHDEVVPEKHISSFDAVADITRIMSQPLDWTDGLPLGADSFATDYYKKE